MILINIDKTEWCDLKLGVTLKCSVKLFFVLCAFEQVFMVGIAQLVRVPDCGSGGRGFESHYPPHFFLFITLGCSQAVRHQTLTLASAGSNPAVPATILTIRVPDAMRRKIFKKKKISS